VVRGGDHPKSFKKAVIELRTKLAEKIQKEKRDEVNCKPWKDNRETGEGFVKGASTTLYELLLCLDINLKSGDNIRNMQI